MTPNVTDIKRTTFWKIGGTQNVPSGKLHEIKGKKKILASKLGFMQGNESWFGSLALGKNP